MANSNAHGDWHDYYPPGVPEDDDDDHGYPDNRKVWPTQTPPLCPTERKEETA